MVFNTLIKPEPQGNEVRLRFRTTNAANAAHLEIHTHVCDSTDVAVLCPHIRDLKHKIDQVVTNIAHRGPSYFQLITCSLGTDLATTWAETMIDHPPAARTVNEFDATVHHFMTNYVVDNQCHELLQFLRTARKPVNMSVVDTINNVRRLNGYVTMFEGVENPLNNCELLQAFFNIMPMAWKDRFTTNNEDLNNYNLATLMSWMKKQETSAQKIAANNAEMCHRAEAAKKKLLLY